MHLDNGWAGDVWSEHVHLAGAASVASYVDGPVPGGPAVTRHPYGDGAGWYVASRLDPEATDALVDLLIEESGVTPVAATRPGVEVTRRHQADGADSWVFVVNHTDEPATLDLTGHDLVTDQPVTGRLSVPRRRRGRGARGALMLAAQRRARSWPSWRPTARCGSAIWWRSSTSRT